MGIRIRSAQWTCILNYGIFADHMRLSEARHNQNKQSQYRLHNQTNIDIGFAISKQAVCEPVLDSITQARLENPLNHNFIKPIERNFEVVGSPRDAYQDQMLHLGDKLKKTLQPYEAKISSSHFVNFNVAYSSCVTKVPGKF